MEGIKTDIINESNILDNFVSKLKNSSIVSNNIDGMNNYQAETVAISNVEEEKAEEKVLLAFNSINVQFDEVGAYLSEKAESFSSYIDEKVDSISSWWNTVAVPALNNAGSATLDALENTLATISTGILSFTEGIMQFGESIVDFIGIVGTMGFSLPTLFADGIQALWGLATGNDWDSLTEKLWNGTKSFVADDHVTTWFDEFYETTPGKWIKDNSYFFDNIRGIGSGLGYISGIVVLSYFTGGAPLIAGLLGSANGAEKAWGEGASISEGLTYGSLAGLWEGLQFYIGGKISNLNLLGKAGGKSLDLFGSTGCKLLNILSRVALDGVDGGTEGFIQPLLMSIYKDGYYDDEGNYIEFTDDDNFFERLQEIYDDAGGFQNVMTNAAVGSIGSTIGEIFDLRKYFQKDSNRSVNVETNMNTNDGVKYNPEHNYESSVIESDISVSNNIDHGNSVLNNNSSSATKLFISDDESINQMIKNLAEQYDFDIDDPTAVAWLNMYAKAADRGWGIDSNVDRILKKLDKIKDCNPGLGMTSNTNGYFFWDGPNILCIAKDLFDYGEDAARLVGFHETGHTLLHSVLGEDKKGPFGTVKVISSPQSFLDALDDARINADNNVDELCNLINECNIAYDNAVKETEVWYDTTLKASEEKRISDFIKSIYDSGDLSELNDILSNVKKSNDSGIKEILENSGLSMEEIDSIMNNRELMTDIAIKQNAIDIKAKHRNLLMSDFDKYGDYRRYSSITNSILQKVNIGKNLDGSDIITPYGHNDSYWLRDAYLCFDELMADYFSITCSGRGEALSRLKNIFGNKIFDEISKTYGIIYDKMMRGE